MSSSSSEVLSILEITTKGIKSSLTTVENVDPTKIIAAPLDLPSSENQPDPPTSIFNKGKDKRQMKKKTQDTSVDMQDTIHYVQSLLLNKF